MRNLAVIAFAALVASAVPTWAQTVIPLSAITTQPCYDSAKVSWQPSALPPGTEDVRFVYCDAGGKPTGTVKYAGLNYLWPGNNTAPLAAMTEIQVQNLTPGSAQIGEIQAVNAVGEAPAYNLIGMNDVIIDPNGAPPANAMVMLGSDSGPTLDGLDSTNGQGMWNSQPEVLAQSAPFVIECNPSATVTPDAGATQSWSSTFSSPTTFSAAAVTATPEIAAAGNYDIQTVTATEQGAAAPYSFITQQVDSFAGPPTHTQIFQMDRHLMWVLFDGGTFGSNDPLHQAHAYGGIQPPVTFNVTAATCLKLQWSVDDLNIVGRKAVEFLIQPADDNIRNFSGLDMGPGAQMNTGNHLLMVRVSGNAYTVTAGTGIVNGVAQFVAVDGAAGQTSPGGHYAGRSVNGGRDDETPLRLGNKRGAMGGQRACAVERLRGG
jgi:hypothetical protein